MSDNTNTAPPKEIQGEEMNNKSQSQQYEYDVFISYRHEHGSDKAIAIKVYLEQCGRKVYMDTFDNEGGRLKNTIPVALRKSRNLIVVISSIDCFKEKQNDTDWIHYEITSAFEQKKNIVPVYYGVTCKDLNERRTTDSIGDSEKEIINKIVEQQSVEFHNDNPSGSLNQINKRLKNSILWKIKNNIRFFTVLLFILFGIAICIISLCNQYEENDNLYASINKLDNINKEIEELRNTINEPYIVFVGGGSVKQYLSKKKIDIKNHSNYFYVNLPSGNACNLLEEEVRKDKQSTPFSFIILSAEQINNSIKNRFRTLKDRPVRIVEIELGKDSLVVYTTFKYNENKELNKSSLETLLERNNIKIYATRENSGTRNKYEAFLKDSIGKSILDSKHIEIFLDEEEGGVSSKVNNNTAKVFLGSQYYKPQLDSIYSLKVISNDSTTVKNLYLYILAFQKNNGFKIDTAAYIFLKEINRQDSSYINSKILDETKSVIFWNKNDPFIKEISKTN